VNRRSASNCFRDRITAKINFGFASKGINMVTEIFFDIRRVPTTILMFYNGIHSLQQCGKELMVCFVGEQKRWR
jgi:hypothetical protein